MVSVSSVIFGSMFSLCRVFLICCTMSGSLLGGSVHSIRSGDFFDPEVWADNRVPDMVSDSIFVTHDLTYYQEMRFPGGAYLHISSCAIVCGNAFFILEAGSFVRVEGRLYTGEMLVYGRMENHGYVDIVPRLTVSGGGSWKTSCGWLRVMPGDQDCTRDGVLNSTTLNTLINRNEVIVTTDSSCNCFKRIEFGDGVVLDYMAGQVSHTYQRSGKYLLSDSTLCPCDTFVRQRWISIDSVCGISEKWTIFPNPGEGYFTVGYTSCMPQTQFIPLFNSVGQLVRYVVLTANETVPLDLSGLAPGIYLLATPAGSSLKAQRIVVIN